MELKSLVRRFFNKESIIHKILLSNSNNLRKILYSIPAILYIYALYRYFKYAAKRPSVYFNRENQRMVSLYQSLYDILGTKYFPTFWASNRHLNTIIGSFIRRNPSLSFKREFLRMKDGGQVALDWHVDGINDDSRPILFFMPGLTGSSESSYIRHAIESATEIGYQCVVLIYRGLLGVPLLTPKGYNGEYTGDIRESILHILNLYPDRDIHAIGYSLGSNILCKYIGEEGDQCVLKSAVSIGNPYDFYKSSHTLESNRLYSKYLTRGLIRYVKDNFTSFTNHPHLSLDMNAILACKGLRDFDSLLTSRMSGFSSADEYYNSASCTNVIDNVRIPLLLISAIDDPVVNEEGIPIKNAEKSDYIMLVVTSKGGHLGFLEGLWPSGKNWSDRLMKKFFEIMKNNDNNKNINK